MPVASGSRVPPWPIFGARRRRRKYATTWNEVAPAPFSTGRMPEREGELAVTDARRRSAPAVHHLAGGAEQLRGGVGEAGSERAAGGVLVSAPAEPVRDLVDRNRALAAQAGLDDAVGLRSEEHTSE